MRFVRYPIVTSACALAILQTNLPAAAESIPVGPVADAFYAPPSPLLVNVVLKTGAEFVGYIELPHHNGQSKSEHWKVTRES